MATSGAARVLRLPAVSRPPEAYIGTATGSHYERGFEKDVMLSVI